MLPEYQETIDLIAWLSAPFVWIGASILGNWARHRWNEWHLPYTDRVAKIKEARK